MNPTPIIMGTGLENEESPISPEQLAKSLVQAVDNYASLRLVVGCALFHAVANYTAPSL